MSEHKKVAMTFSNAKLENFEKVEFTSAKLGHFIRHYRHAVRHELKSFMFEGNEYLTDYAKHLIKFLGSQLKHNDVMRREVDGALRQKKEGKNA